MNRLERAESDLAPLEQRIEEKLQPYAAQLALLQEIPGVERTFNTKNFHESVNADSNIQELGPQSLRQLAEQGAVRRQRSVQRGKNLGFSTVL